METSVIVEYLREALLSLYDPPALASTTLSKMLVRRGRLRSESGLYDLLTNSVEQLKPPVGAPAQSPGWRHYRYLQLRYVDCASHDSISQEFGVSSRHAGRIHQDAPASLASILFPNEPIEPSPSPAAAKLPTYEPAAHSASTHRRCHAAIQRSAVSSPYSVVSYPTKRSTSPA